MQVCKAEQELFIRIDIRALEDERNHLIQSRQSLLRLQVIPQIVFFPFFKPLLPSIVKLPQKMSSNLMIHNPFNRKFSIPNWQPHNNST